MLMAAGLGTRLRPFTNHFPKALIPVMGVPVAQFAIDHSCRYGVKKIVANIHHCPEIAKNGLLNLDTGKAQLDISDESNLLLGSAGGIRKALHLLGDQAFFLINADVLSDVNLFELEQSHLAAKKKFGAHMTLAILQNYSGDGEYREIILDDKREKIIGLGNLARGRPFYSGIAVIESKLVAGLPLNQSSDFVNDLLIPAIHIGKVGVYWVNQNSKTTEKSHPTYWFDIGSPKFWLETHLAILSAKEVPVTWRHRIESINVQIAPGIWCSKDLETEARQFKLEKPCYCGSFNSKAMEFKKLGPNAVVYGGSQQNRGPYSNGIGFGGVWKNI